MNHWTVPEVTVGVAVSLLLLAVVAWTISTSWEEDWWFTYWCVVGFSLLMVGMILVFNLTIYEIMN